MVNADELARLNVERHGAIRVGLHKSLLLFGGCLPLWGCTRELLRSLAGRGAGTFDSISAIDDASLARNPFRVFTSLLRLSLSRTKFCARKRRRFCVSANLHPTLSTTVRGI